ncbi:hypothetical protein B0H13DRAFT_2415140 [Mycena leptocephala]|nr:hypothetical protein B0H13DRAFT_2415140 [Mycena leptocephala]
MPPYAPTFHSDENDNNNNAGLQTPIDIDDFNDDKNLAALRAIFRRINELEAQATKEKNTKPPSPSMKTFTNAGRCIHKVVATFGPIDSLIAEHDRCQELEVEQNSGDDVHDEEEEPTMAQNRAYNGYKELIRFVPALRKALLELEHDELTGVISSLRNGARNARSDNTKNLKAAIVPWLQTLFPEMDPLDPDSRDDRGVYNDFLMTLLAPTEYDISDEEYGNISFTSPVSVKTMPLANTQNLPSTSDGRTKKKEKAKAAATPKRSVTAIIGLNHVTGRSIAYAAVQYRVAISDQHHWEESDGSFDYAEFYNNVVDYFEFPPGPIAKLEIAQLLDFWNTAVFRNHRSNWSLYEGGSAPRSSVMSMKAARAAREVGMTSIPDMSLVIAAEDYLVMATHREYLRRANLARE